MSGGMHPALAGAALHFLLRNAKSQEEGFFLCPYPGHGVPHVAGVGDGNERVTLAAQGTAQ